MEEKRVPWWRKALSFALDGIRSGFGLFSKPQRENSFNEPEIISAHEITSEEEPQWIEHSPTIKPIAETVTEAESDAPPEIAVALEPEAQETIAVAPEEGPEATKGAAIEAEDEFERAQENPVPAPQTELDAEAETTVEETAVDEAAIEHGLDPVANMPGPLVEAEPEAAVEAKAAGVVELPAEVKPEAPAAERQWLAETVEEPEVEVEQASEAETETESEISAEPEAFSEPAEPPAIAAAALPTAAEEPKQGIEAPAEIAVEHETLAGLPTVEEAIPERAVDPVEAMEQFAEPEALPETETKPEPVIIQEPIPTEDSVPEAAVSSVELSEPVPEAVIAETAVQPDAVEEEPSKEVIPAAESVPKNENAAEEVTGEIPEPVIEPMELNEPIPEQPAESTEATEAEPAVDAVASETVPDEEAPESVAETVLPPERREADQPGVEAVSTIAVPAEVETLAAVPEQAVEAAGVPEPASAPPHKPFIKLESRDNEADLSPFSVIVSQVYDGPLDLLLDLIRKQDIDIYDIPIARITAQFLAYVNQLKATDVDVAGEFIYTASLLIHIKSKMLLPRAPSGQDDDAEDPRRELVERLLEHERFKNAAQMLQQKQMLEAASWTNPGLREFQDDTSAEPEIAADTVDLVRIFRDILERARNRPVIDVEEDSVTVGQMIQFLSRRLTMEDKPVALRRLLSHTRSERALIAMFLALLELVRLQAILLRQDLAFSEIFIKKHTGFEAVMNEGAAGARDDWR